MLSSEIEKHRAEQLQRRVFQSIHAIKASWVALAEALYEFQVGQAWKPLGFRDFSHWADSATDLSKSRANQLVNAWRVLVVKGNVHPRLLIGLDSSKMEAVLPVVRNSPDRALEAVTDAQSLNRNQMRDKWVPQERRIRSETVKRCPSCGAKLHE